MSIEDLRVVYDAVNTDNDLLTFELFVEMVDDNDDVPTILSWFKGSTVH